ncbi:MAG: hypothetical protein LUQ07_02545 [Methanospirillum sp.]|nr:hypothetical protein [Methanospirillum sp.]
MALPLGIPEIITVLLNLSGGCGYNKHFILGDQSSLEPEQSAPVSVPSSAIVVYHFHPARQCYSCQILKNHAEETMNPSFTREQVGGRLIFEPVNIELPEDAGHVSRFGVISSSLMIGYTSESVFHAGNVIEL